MKTNNTAYQATIPAFEDDTSLDFLFDSSGDTIPINELTDAFDTSDPIARIEAAERDFGAPYALIGNWIWARNTR